MLRATLYEQEIRRAAGVPGGENRLVDGVAPLGAGEDRCLYFINHSITASIRESLAMREGCILIAPKGSSREGGLGDCLVVETDDPRAAISRVLGFIHDERRISPGVTNRLIAPSASISAMAVVDGHVEIGDGVVIEPFCKVGPDVKIARGSILRSGACVYPRVVIGEDTSIGTNSVIGHQGYGFVRDEAGNKTRMPHLGGVIIGSHVEIGALSTVQSGTIDATVIEDHAKIDDRVHVGHNVRIAKAVSVTAGVVIAGHAIIDEEAWIGVNSSIREGRRIGSYALVGMDVSVQENLDDNAVARAARPDIRTRSDDDQAAIGFTKKR